MAAVAAAPAIDIHSLRTGVRDLETLLAGKEHILSQIKPLVAQLKIATTKLHGLQYGVVLNEQAVSELQLARRIAELSASAAIVARDMQAFERAAVQAKQFYLDYSTLPLSGSQNFILGLNLMRLLAQNRIAELHTELELISGITRVNGQTDDPFLKYPLELEKLVMEGSYAKIAAQTTELPDPHYAWFLEMLLDTVRIEVADCTERAYGYLPLPYALRLMLLPDVDQLQAWVDAEGRDGSWAIDRSTGKVNFLNPTMDLTSNQHALAGSAAACALDDAIPQVELIHRSLKYAKELDRII